MQPKIILLIALALACFAGNSLLCRLGLASGDIDATTFTTVRLASGALALALLARRRARALPERQTPPGWVAAAALFLYAAPFSYAYLRLGAAMGALILFGSVQVTMIGWGIVRGERPSALAWFGIVVAVLGLIGLTAPGKSAPAPLGAALMAFAGVAWGVYSLRGRLSTGDAVLTTSSNFTRSLPFVALLVCIAGPAFGLHATGRGIALAAASGAVASGIGYSLWFAALPHISATRAAILQLLVPILAAAAAIPLLGEAVSIRLVATSAAILGGVALTILEKLPSRPAARGR